MANIPEFDSIAAHKHFSQKCFNQAWDLMDKTDRTDEENRQMEHLSLASIWHWTQRDDCTPKNLAVGYWQASRIYALLGQTDNARRYGQLSLEKSGGSEPFYVGYAYEALARAEQIDGKKDKAGEYLAKAKEQSELISNTDYKKMLDEDLDSLKI